MTVEEILSEFGEVWQRRGISEDSWECLVDRLRADGYVDRLSPLDVGALDDFDESTGLSGLPPEFQEFAAALTFYTFDRSLGCLSSTELEMGIGLTDVEDEDAFPLIEFLKPGCEEGVFADCDMLLLISNLGSPLENTALTCGGRNEPRDFTSCVLHYQSEEDYRVLVRDCEAGFYLACDILYGIADTLDDQVFAASCGGTRELTLFFPCRLAYGYGTRD